MAVYFGTVDERVQVVMGRARRVYRARGDVGQSDQGGPERMADEGRERLVGQVGDGRLRRDTHGLDRPDQLVAGGSASPRWPVESGWWRLLLRPALEPPFLAWRDQTACTPSPATSAVWLDT